MALQKDIIFKGLKVPKAYIAITGLQVDKIEDNFQVSASIGTYTSKGSEPLEELRFPVQFTLNLKGENIIAQAYAAMKLDDRWKGGADV